MFPQLTTRRLGVRGKSRYNYYGLSVKPGSMYFNTKDSRQTKRDRSESISKLELKDSKKFLFGRTK